MKTFKQVENSPVRSICKLRNSTRADGKRVYFTPEGLSYPSITTILGSFPKPELEEWRNRVGWQEAEKIGRQAAQKGTAIHGLCEKFVQNQEIISKDFMPFEYQQFLYIKEELINHVDNIHGLEKTLRSDRLKIAGTTDLIAEWDGELAIVDYKGSTRQKEKGWITDYFLQATAYSCMLYERTGLQAKKIVILISVDHEGSQVFVENTSDWIDKLLKKLKVYRETIACSD